MNMQLYMECINGRLHRLFYPQNCHLDEAVFYSKHTVIFSFTIALIGCVKPNPIIIVAVTTVTFENEFLQLDLARPRALFVLGQDSVKV